MRSYGTHAVFCAVKLTMQRCTGCSGEDTFCGESHIGHRSII